MDAFGWAVVALAVFFLLFFSFTNGFNDASAVVATTIASGAASPRNAVVLAAVTGALGVVLGGSAVANTIKKMVVLPPHVAGAPQLSAVAIVGAALAGAVLWNLTTWRLGIPSSSSHALVGGLVGAALVARGPDAVNWGAAWLSDPLHQPIGGLAGVVFGLVLAPALGLSAAWGIHKVVKLALRNARFRVNTHLKRAQILTSSVLSFAHGANDGQKAMGIFVVILLYSDLEGGDSVPLWVRAVVLGTITAGTLGGGWPIMKTLGRRIFKLEPVHSLDSQVASAAVLFGATNFGAPVSTTHVVAASVMGVGAAERVSAVRWGVAKHILQAWGTTIPASALAAGAIMAALHYGAGL
ncbi:MAG TPA: inorganic phosphate transporter [Candidatus Thermoplasmatota archaeon]|nr:inorganic phosphate transporter [Candidatus Thermoplasmatota archaeon]